MALLMVCPLHLEFCYCRKGSGAAAAPAAAATATAKELLLLLLLRAAVRLLVASTESRKRRGTRHRQHVKRLRFLEPTGCSSALLTEEQEMQILRE